MLRTVDELIGYGIHAVDGDIGHVKDFYFEDESWKIRYAVVNCGVWLFGRKVLVSPEVFQGTPDGINRDFNVKVSRDQVKNSPNIDTDKPVSRQQEENLNNYYNWPIYWSMTSTNYDSMIRPSLGTKRDQIEGKGKSHLRSIKEVGGYSIELIDGNIGHVEDFIVDYKTWTIRFMIVDTQKYINDGLMLIAIPWIDNISWSRSQISVNLTKEQIKESPRVDQLMPIGLENEKKLDNYYKKELTKERVSVGCSD